MLTLEPPISAQAQSSPSGYRRMGALLGFLAKAEVDAIFKQHPFKVADDKDPLDVWRQFDQQRQTLQPMPNSEFEILPPSLRSAEDMIRRRKTFRQHYETVADYVFGFARIDSLLAPQWYADLDYIDELGNGLSADMTSEEQLLFALSEGTIHQPMVAGGQVLFTSARRDLHADPIPSVRQTGDGEFEIVVRAVSRPNYVQVATMGDRLILTNGVHKVCALYKAGFTYCYCVARPVDNLAETGLVTQTSLFRDSLFRSNRPGLVVDFVGSATAAAVYMRSAYQVLQVVVNVATITVPALPRL